MSIMNITRERLLNAGFIEHQAQGISFYTFGELCLTYNYGLWLIGTYINGMPTSHRIYVETMEELNGYLRNL